MKPFKKLTAYTDETPAVASTGSVMNQPATVEEAIRIELNADQMKSFIENPWIEINGIEYCRRDRIEYLMDKHAQQPKSIDERHWEMEPLEPEPNLAINPVSVPAEIQKAINENYWDLLDDQSVKPEPMGGKSDLIAFASWIAGHDEETIQQMYNDWSRHRRI